MSRQVCTVAVHREHEDFSELGPPEYSQLHAAAQLLCFAVLAENEYWTPNLDRYANSAVFRLEVHVIRANDTRYGFSVPLTGHPPAGIAGYKLDEMVITGPPQSIFVKLPSPKPPILEVLQRMMTEPDCYGKGVFEAIRLFNSAISDDEWQDISYVLATYYHAFNHILLRGGSKVERMLDPMAKLLGNQDEAQIPHLCQWLRELALLRHPVVHGNDRQAARWTSWEHAAMAAFTFPLLLKCRLACHGYALDDDDLARVEALELLAGLDHPAQESQELPNVSIWHEALWRNRRDRYFRELAKKLIRSSDESGSAPTC